jgi:pimeloyl-ACP methyl ester carboxylesterase
MNFLFDDNSQSFEALRAAGYAAFAGADLGEVLVTCRNIPEGDDEAWSTEWAATAARIEGIAREALGAGHGVSAREAFLRASNYYRAADFYRREDPDNDPESMRLYQAAKDTFAEAVNLFEAPVRALEIPYENTTLPGYLFLVDDSGAQRPTVLFHGGFDSTLQEDYYVIVPGALRRGYNVICFDGPGQGDNIRKGMTFRPDWEAVVTPAVDYALTMPEVDPDRIVLMGMSLGGYLAARAAAFEHRLAACVLYDGVWDTSAALAPLAAAIAATPGGIKTVMANNTGARWMLSNGFWTYGAKDFEDLERISKPYTLEGVADRITCPTLVLDAENDEFFKGQADQVYAALTCEKELILFREDEGGGEHCQEGALFLLHQRTFDWVDNLFSRGAPRRVATV